MAVNLRNKPIDRRRLSAEDRQFDTSKRQKALAMAKQRRGQAAYQYSRRPNTTQKYSGGNAFAAGIGAQQARLRKVGDERRAAEALRPDKVTDIKSDLF